MFAKIPPGPPGLDEFGSDCEDQPGELLGGRGNVCWVGVASCELVE